MFCLRVGRRGWLSGAADIFCEPLPAVFANQYQKGGKGDVVKVAIGTELDGRVRTSDEGFPCRQSSTDVFARDEAG